MTQDIITQAAGFLERGDAASAFSLLTEAADRGNGQAALVLGDLRLGGQAIRRDLAQAQSLYARAAELGEVEGQAPAIALLACGPANVVRDWPAAVASLASAAQTNDDARRQCELIAEMSIDRDGEPIAATAPEVLHGAPLVATFPGFLSRPEREYLVELAGRQLQPAVVVDPRTGQFIRDPIRTGTSAAFALVMENPVLHAINRRIARASGTNWSQGEPVQILSYQPGQEYKLHSDALPPGQPQRVKTFLVALNDDYEGGATAFPALGLELRLKAGDALLFENVDALGRPAAEMRHAGMPVTRGTKFLLSRWIRERPIDLTGPPGRPF